MYKYGGSTADYPHSFEADGINHNLGFINLHSDKHTCLGIKNGGFDGPIDFITDGDTVTGISNRDYEKNEVKPAQISDMKKFLQEFDKFESAFLTWIDSLSPDKSTDTPQKTVDYEKLAVAVIKAFESDREESGRVELAKGLQFALEKYVDGVAREAVDATIIALTGYGINSLIQESKSVNLKEF